VEWINEVQDPALWPARFLIAHGQVFAPSPRPEDTPQGTMRDCFANAFRLATDEPAHVTYYEGVGKVTDWPLVLPHAWCVDQQGRVIDPTWHHDHTNAPEVYCGLPLPLTMVEPQANSESFGTFYAYLRRATEFAQELDLEVP